MQRVLSGLFIILGITLSPVTQANPTPAGNETQPATVEATDPVIRMETSMGEIQLQLDAKRAPKTVANFLQYVNDGFYNGTIFHRVIGNFMIQGGGFTQDYQRKTTRAPIINEADNGLANDIGTIAMARTAEPHSATAQFFINVENNDFLNHSNPTPRGWGYAVFGRVIKGMDTVNKIKSVATGPGGPFPTDVPRTAVVINNVEVIK